MGSSPSGKTCPNNPTCLFPNLKPHIRDGRTIQMCLRFVDNGKFDDMSDKEQNLTKAAPETSLTFGRHVSHKWSHVKLSSSYAITIKPLTLIFALSPSKHLFSWFAVETSHPVPSCICARKMRAPLDWQLFENTVISGRVERNSFKRPLDGHVYVS